MSDFAVLRPGTVVYRVHPREYILDWGIVPRHSLIVKDDTSDNLLYDFFDCLRVNRGLDLGDWRKRLGDDAYTRLVRPLVDNELLVHDELLAPISAGVASEKPAAVGLVGAGVPAYAALETLARHRSLLSTTVASVAPGWPEDALRSVFPYCDGESIDPVVFARRLGLPCEFFPWGEHSFLTQVDLVLVALPRLDFSLLLDVESVLRDRGIPWLHVVVSCAFGLAGPIGGAGVGVRVLDLIANLKRTGFVQADLPDPYIEPTSEEEVQGSSMAVVAQTVPKAVVEGLRFVRNGASSLRGAIHVVDGDRGLVARSRVPITASAAHNDEVALDPAIAPPGYRG